MHVLALTALAQLWLPLYTSAAAVYHLSPCVLQARYLAVCVSRWCLLDCLGAEVHRLIPARFQHIITIDDSFRLIVIISRIAN